VRSRSIRVGLLAIGLTLVAALPAAAIVPSGNLIADPGAETGPTTNGSQTVPPPNPPWFSGLPGASQVQYGASGGFPGTDVSGAIGGGSAFFAGGPSQTGDASVHSIQQTVDLSGAAAEIDRGQVRADLTGFLGGFTTDGDNAQVNADFTDTGGDNTFLSLQIGPVTATDRGNATTLISRAASGVLPAGVRQVTITVTFTRTSAAGTYNDGYADNLSLTLTDQTPPVPPGLPPQLDFTWSPRADVQIAGAPVGGLQFQATAGPGVTYAWDFDYQDATGFQGDPTAAGPTPRHGFTADGAHDTANIVGADGQRRRVYTVRLRATAANGATADVTHQLIVVPDNAPKVDFVIDGSGNPVSHPVTFTPHVSDPDQTSRTADSIDHLEWDFDSPINGQAAVDLICNGDGTNCRLPDGTAPGPWLVPVAGGGVQVDFWRRALAAHGLNPLGDLNLDALPTTLPSGAPLLGGLGVLTWAKAPFYVDHDPRLAYLYENATLLMQSSFNTDAGEATGARYGAHAFIARAAHRAHTATTFAKPVVQYNQIFSSAVLGYRTVTLTAVDSAGVRTSVTHALPLRPDAPPQLSARFVNASADGSTQPIASVPSRRHAHGKSTQGQPLTQILSQPLTTADELVYDASATADPDGQIAYYTLEVGKPFNEPGTCQPGKPFVAGPGGAISLDSPDGAIRPGAFFPGPGIGGTGPGTPPGAVGNVNVPAGANAKALQKVSFRSASSLPTLGDLIGHTYFHPCKPYSDRNVVPLPFKALAGPDVRPAARAGVFAQPINPALLKRIGNLEYDTTAIVTNDPSKLRFRIPKPDTYSVAVGAYDKEGQGAVQRTDGFQILTSTGKCSRVSGATVALAGRNLGFSGLCIDFGSSRRYYWSTQAIDIDGVALRPDPGSGIFVDTCKGDRSCTPRIFATRAHEPDLSRPVDVNALDAQAGGVAVLVDGDPVARFDPLSATRMRDWISGSDAAQPVVPANATYKGSPVPAAEHHGPDATTFHVTFGQPEGSSTTSFQIELPTAFSIDGGGSAPTKQVLRYGFDEPRITTLTTHKFADIAQRRAHDRAVARATALSLSGTLNLDGLSLGPVQIIKGTVSFDPAKGYFEVTVSEAQILLPDPNPASLHLKIEGGDLKEAGGSVGTSLQIFPGVFLNRLSFSIVTDPLTLQGGAQFSALKLLTGDINLTVRPEPLLLRLDGSIGLGGITLGNAFVEYNEERAESLTFGGHFGYNFGPVSMNAGLKGGISFKTSDFYIEGQGRACLGFCLGVDALVSNIAVAGCGTIDLAVTSVSAGFAFTFKDASLDVFTGCDLSGYIPAVFKTRAGPSLRANPGGGGTITVAAGTQQTALRFRAAAGSSATPVVTLTAPDGQQFSTSAAPGNYAFSAPAPVGIGGGGLAKTPSALVDQDPVDHVTTFLIANPTAGDWKVAVDPSGPPVASVDVATGAHLPDRTLQTKVEPATLSNGGVQIGTQAFAAGATASSSARRRSHRTLIAPAIVRELRSLPSLERRRLRGVVLNIPAGLEGTLTLLDAGPTGVNVIRTIDLAKSAGRVPIAFDPSADAGTHRLRAFLTHADGIPRQMIDIGSFVGPPVPTPSRPGLNMHRANGNVFIDVTPGTAGALSGPITRFELLASTSAGQRIERFIDVSNARRMSHGRFRVDLGRFASNVSVRADGRMLYGNVAGASSIGVLRGR
jgi:hypothetical protein